MRRPRFIAEQVRNANGLLGRLVAFLMAHETFAINRRAIDALEIQSGDHVLDVGCGHGRSLTELVRRAPNGRIAGADPSHLMALCVHVLYFWPSLDAGFREIGRVLKPGGRLALVFRTSADKSTVRAFPAEVYCFRSYDEVFAALDVSGFSLAHADERRTEPMLLVASKRGHPHGVS